MTSRATEAGASQTLAWTPEGHLDTVTEGTESTEYVYDADGNRLLQRSPGKTTLYLGDTELEDSASGGPVLGTRYYAGYAVRSANGLKWTCADHHGTGQAQIDAVTLDAARQRSLPYGEERGPQASQWEGSKGYVGGVKDDTGLTHLGAREYDPSIGRFISVDPIMDLTDPDQWHGYAYSHNNPTTFNDPSGLLPLMSGSADVDNRKLLRTNKRWVKGKNGKPTVRKKPLSKANPRFLDLTERECNFLCDVPITVYDSEAEPDNVGGSGFGSGANPGDGPSGGSGGAYQAIYCANHLANCGVMYDAANFSKNFAHDQKRRDQNRKALRSAGFYNALRHASWMAFAVYFGLDVDEALDFGIAHEKDGDQAGNLFGSRDSNIDLNNNAVGARVGADVVAELGHFRPLDQDHAGLNRIIEVLGDMLINGSCNSAGCLDTSSSER